MRELLRDCLEIHKTFSLGNVQEIWKHSSVRRERSIDVAIGTNDFTKGLCQLVVRKSNQQNAASDMSPATAGDNFVSSEHLAFEQAADPLVLPFTKADRLRVCGRGEQRGQSYASIPTLVRTGVNVKRTV